MRSTAVRRSLFWTAALSTAAAASSAWAQGAAVPTPTAPQASNEGQSADRDQNAIVVTARRFEERLQDVPIAVTALTQDDIRRQDLRNLRDLATKVPGFAFESLSPIVVQPVIRGQTNLRVDSPVQNVAFYVDGIYLQRGYLVDQQLLQLDRVEVIKGPQSALYGRNAFAGAVNMVTTAPSLTDARAQLQTTIGNYDRYEIRGFASLPIIPDRLTVMVGGAATTFDGTWRNNHPLARERGTATRRNLGGVDNQLFQARVIAKPVDAVTIDALYIHTERNEEGLPTYAIATAGGFAPFNGLNASPLPPIVPPGFPAVPVQNRLWVGRLPVNVPIQPGDPRPPGLLVDPRGFGLRGPTDIVSARLAYDPGGPLSAVYQFGYTSAQVFGRGSPATNPLVPFISAPPLPIFNYGTIFDSSGSGSFFEGYSHDLRVDYKAGERFRAFVGMNFSQTTDLNSNLSEFGPTNSLAPVDPRSAFPIGPGLPFPALTPANPSALLQRNAYFLREEDIYSPYLFVGWNPTDKLEITFEARYTWEHHQGTDLLTRQSSLATLPPLTPGGAPRPNPDFLIQALNPPVIRRTIEYFTPRVTINYKFTRDNMVYFSAARGVKAGNFNAGFRFIGQRQYESEDNWTYEVGSKNQFGRVSVNVAAFYTDWNNLQTNVVRLEANGLPPSSFFQIVPTQVGNLKGVTVWGLEGEATWRATDNLSLFVGAAYNQSRYKDGTVSQRFGASGNCDGIVCANTTVPGTPFPVLDIGGNNLERVPDFNGLAGFNWDAPLGSNPTNRYFLRGDVTYKSKQFVDEANLAFVPDRALVNATAGVQLGKFDIFVWAKNLFDQQYVTASLFLIGVNGARSASYVPSLGERRTVGVTAGVRF